MPEEKVMKAKYSEWQASLWGACFIAFGLGVLLAQYGQRLAIVAILLGVGMHGWGMYKIHQRNK